MAMRNDNASQRFGSTRFAWESELDMGGLFNQEDHSIFLGYFAGRPVFHNSNAGAIIVAGARSGKFRDVLCRSLLSGTCLNSIVMLDPKGEGAYVSQDQTADGKYCAYWNPTGLHGLPQDSIDFLSHLTLDSPTLISDLKVFWENLLAKGKSADTDYFIPRGRQYGEAICLAICEMQGALTFPALFEAINLIPGGGDQWLDFAFQMSKSRFSHVRTVEEEIAAARHETGNGFRGIVGELLKAVACLSDDTLMAAVSPPFTMSLQDIIDGDQAWQVYLMPPVELIQPWSMVLKSAFVSLMVLKSRAISARRIICLIDECGQLVSGESGGFPLIPRLYSFGAGVGLVPVTVFQSVAQMNDLAPNAKDIILSSSASTLMFGMRGDYESCRDCSRRLGTQTLEFDDFLAQERAHHARNQAMQSLFSGGDPLQVGFALSHQDYAANHKSKQQRELRTLDEIMNMPSNKAYLFNENVEFPIELERRPYWEDRNCAGTFHPNPAYPPLDRVQVATWYGMRTRRIIKEPVPLRFAHLPQYRNGIWSRAEV